MMDRRCKDCDWFEGFEMGSRTGFCRRFPPERVERDEEDSYEFALTHESEWCGEHSDHKRARPDNEANK